tara:strand:- start:828 stop:2150 length:1323 start_codon:yes stop_codon:yes gene_type:complete
MAEQESMVPVAAIVCFLLGVTSLILLDRSKNRIWMDRLAGYMLSWCLVFFGLRYAAASIRDTSWWQNTDITSQFDFFQYLFFSFTISAFVIVAIFPFIYPYPIFQKSSTIKLVAPATFLGSLAIIITMMLTEYKYVGFWQILFTPAFIISIPVYFRFLSEEMLEGDDTARRMSLAAGIILIAFFGQQMTWWLAQLISINDEFIARFTIEAGVGSHSYIPNWIGYTVTNSLGTIAILSLGVGETWRASSKGINGFTIVIYLILGVGLISGIADFAVLDIVDSCMYTICENFPESYNIWYKFTTEALLLLFTPLMVMYILLHFDVIDSEAEQNRWMTRIIVILMLLIVSSTMIELLQSFLPVSSMISSAILAMVVAIFIGWEERIMNTLIAEGESISKKLASLDELHEPDISDNDLQLFSKSMGALTVIIIVLCFLYSSIVG